MAAATYISRPVEKNKRYSARKKAMTEAKIAKVLSRFWR